MKKKILILIAFFMFFNISISYAQNEEKKETPKPEPSFTMQKIGEKEQIRIYDMVYPSDNLKIKGKVFILLRHVPPLPVVILNHDGVKGISNATLERAKFLAWHGFIVLVPSYRGEDGSDGEVEVAKGEVDDVLNLMKIIPKIKEADKKKIAMIGTSHGALITMLAASRTKELKCVVEAYGVMDIFQWWKYLKEKKFKTDDPLSKKVYGEGPSENPEAFKIRDAVNYVSRIQCPVLVIHGDSDDIVPVFQAYELKKALEKYKKTYELYIYPETGHGFLIYAPTGKDYTDEEKEAANTAWDKIIDFLELYLKHS